MRALDGGFDVIGCDNGFVPPAAPSPTGRQTSTSNDVASAAGGNGGGGWRCFVLNVVAGFGISYKQMALSQVVLKEESPWIKMAAELESRGRHKEAGEVRQATNYLHGLAAHPAHSDRDVALVGEVILTLDRFVAYKQESHQYARVARNRSPVGIANDCGVDLERLEEGRDFANHFTSKGRAPVGGGRFNGRQYVESAASFVGGERVGFTHGRNMPAYM